MLTSAMTRNLEEAMKTANASKERRVMTLAVDASLCDGAVVATCICGFGGAGRGGTWHGRHARPALCDRGRRRRAEAGAVMPSMRLSR